MGHKKLYTSITVVLGVLMLYALYNIVMSFVRGYSLDGQFILYFLPTGAGITGLLIFATSGFKKSGLLRLYMCYELFTFPFTVLFYVSFFSRDYGEFSYRPPVDWGFYLGIVIDLLYLASCAVGLWYLSKKRVPKITYYGEGSNRTGQFEPAGGGLRFANLVIDRFLFIFVVFKGFNNYFFLGGGFLSGGYSGLLIVIEMAGLIVYYLLLESIFNTTAGKCATNTTIVNNSGQRPGFGQVLGRTFCRLIPFEAFSFLGEGARGWHDSLTNTYVVETVDEEAAALNEITLDAEMNTQ